MNDGKQFHCIAEHCAKRGSCAFAVKIHPRQAQRKPHIPPFSECQHYTCKEHKWTHDNTPHCIFCGQDKHEYFEMRHWRFG